MRALLITSEGVIETAIGEKVENTYRLMDGLPYSKKVGNLESMYRLMGCQTITSAGYPDRAHACWADDEALLTMQDGDQATKVSWHPEPLIGRLLVTGINSQGGTTSATLSVDELQSMVKHGVLHL